VLYISPAMEVLLRPDENGEFDQQVFRSIDVLYLPRPELDMNLVTTLEQ
jgi:hypothetical protein